jgi:glyoxylase-like metal-dependent hydrolase (beta-lactamase superfamily II)
MNKLVFSVVAVLAILCGNESFAETPRFEKVSDHCYYLRFEEGEANVAVVVSEEGILMVDPPQEQNLSLVIDALSSISRRAVRWLAFTNPRFFRTAGTRYFAKRGALLLASRPLQAIAESGSETISKYPEILRSWLRHIASEKETASYRWVIFNNEMRLFASDLEIRIMAIQHKARTGGDVVLHVPDEKVLFVGDLYESARYPDIDNASKGSPLEWIDGVEQVINSVPLLKSAIPEEGSESEEEVERTLEERIAVVSAHGEVSNLQNMKDLLEACQSLQRYVERAVDRGRSFDSFLTLSATGPYFSYGNLESYAAQLFEALKTPTEKKQQPNP